MMSMRGFGMRSALMAASVVSLVTGGCTGPAATTNGAAPGSAGYTADGTLEAVAAVSATDAWAVGDLGQEDTPLIVHWNGSSWTQVPSVPASADDPFSAVATPRTTCGCSAL
jgi:hypothetical protein